MDAAKQFIPPPPPPKADKHNGDKLRYELIPTRPLMMLAGVFSFDATKYAAENWRKGLSWIELTAAIQRHLDAFKSGQNNDPTNGGMPHMASVAWCAFVLMEYAFTHPELDDRIDQSTGMVSTYPELQELLRSMPGGISGCITMLESLLAAEVPLVPVADKSWDGGKPA